MKTQDIFLVLFMNLAFGASFISAKIGVNEFPPFLFTSMRFLIIAIILLPFLKIHKGQMFNIMIISIFGGSLHFSFFYLALDNSRSLPIINSADISAVKDSSKSKRLREIFAVSFKDNPNLLA